MVERARPTNFLCSVVGSMHSAHPACGGSSLRSTTPYAADTL